jgi:hypothetical protein
MCSCRSCETQHAKWIIPRRNRRDIGTNLPRSAVGLLVGLGHAVDFARDIGLASATIARRTQESAAALLTRDLDFSDIRRYPPRDYNGILVLRLLTTPMPHKSSE